MVGVGVTVGVRVGVRDATGEGVATVAVAESLAGCPLSEVSETINNNVPSAASPAVMKIPVRRDMRAIVAQLAHRPRHSRVLLAGIQPLVGGTCQSTTWMPDYSARAHMHPLPLRSAAGTSCVQCGVTEP